MRIVKPNCRQHRWAAAVALTAGAIFQISSCNISEEGVITAFADPSGFSDLSTQLHEQSFLGRVFDLDGTVEINFGEED